MLENVSKVHLIGIGGIGVSAVARILLGDGYRVQGSDIRESAITKALREEGAEISIGHHGSNLEGVDLVVVSTAIPSHNVEWVEAKKRGIAIVHRSEILNELVSKRRVIGVTGTHGKGTVSSMIAWILETAGWDPGFVIGGFVNNFQTNAKAGSGEWMVVEVDESDGSHQNYRLDYVICNFLEVDHLNYYKDLDDIILTMRSFLNTSEGLCKVFVNGDCTGNRRMVAGLSVDYATYGVETDVDFKGMLESKSQFPIRFRASQRTAATDGAAPIRDDETIGETTLKPIGDFELNLPGRYNVVNAMAAIAMTLELGVDVEHISTALRTFKGLENRFTIREVEFFTIVKDYISHPTGMRKVIESAKDLAEGRTIAVFKPYRYTLINYLKDEYGAAFVGCDEVIISKMYAAEEDPIPGVDTMTIVRKIEENGIKVTYIEDQNLITDYLSSIIQVDDQVIFFGGDDYFKMADEWADKIRMICSGDEAND